MLNLIIYYFDKHKVFVSELHNQINTEKARANCIEHQVDLPINFKYRGKSWKTSIGRCLGHLVDEQKI